MYLKELYPSAGKKNISCPEHHQQVDSLDVYENSVADTRSNYIFDFRAHKLLTPFVRWVIL